MEHPAWPCGAVASKTSQRPSFRKKNKHGGRRGGSCSEMSISRQKCTAENVSAARESSTALVTCFLHNGQLRATERQQLQTQPQRQCEEIIGSTHTDEQSARRTFRVTGKRNLFTQPGEEYSDVPAHQPGTTVAEGGLVSRAGGEENLPAFKGEGLANPKY